ncbi:MAG TPA: hypothetical protein VIG72_09405 [Pontibacter sp.]
MKRENINTALLLICTVLLAICTYGILTRPTLEELDQRMMYWGQHYGAHFSENMKNR